MTPIKMFRFHEAPHNFFITHFTLLDLPARFFGRCSRQSLPRVLSLRFSGFHLPRLVLSFGFPNPFAANRSSDLSER
ncbi:MAG: hypothetical protein DWH95_08255 [Planctomycetota bacterium]|nr:MAG: hypothetical protein DWH95_08255 [Planctomycetota bacterium]